MQGVMLQYIKGAGYKYIQGADHQYIQGEGLPYICHGFVSAGDAPGALMSQRPQCRPTSLGILGAR